MQDLEWRWQLLKHLASFLLLPLKKKAKLLWQPSFLTENDFGMDTSLVPVQ